MNQSLYRSLKQIDQFPNRCKTFDRRNKSIEVNSFKNKQVGQKSQGDRRNTTIQLEDIENNETTTIKKFDISQRFKSAARNRPKTKN